jgi:hypothetical protein
VPENGAYAEAGVIKKGKRGRGEKVKRVAIGLQ